MEFVPKNVHWLLPEEASPCDILLHFRGQFATAVPAGQAVSFKLLERLAAAQCTQIYVRAADISAWEAWAKKRYPREGISSADPAKASGESRLYGNKRAELLSFVQKSVQKREDGDKKVEQAFRTSLAAMQKVVREPSLDWYFQQFHEPPELFHHNGRVAYSVAIFCGMHPLVHDEELEALLYASLIHELEGDPAANVNTVASQQTLALLEKKKHPVPQKVTELIQMQDELCSGKGFPKNLTRDQIPLPVRVFTLFNHFDVLRTSTQGTRRVRIEKARQQMESRKADYDYALWPLFWEFWEQKVEAL